MPRAKVSLPPSLPPSGTGLLTMPPAMAAADVSLVRQLLVDLVLTGSAQWRARRMAGVHFPRVSSDSGRERYRAYGVWRHQARVP